VPDAGALGPAGPGEVSAGGPERRGQAPRVEPRRSAMPDNTSDLVISMRLLDAAKRNGFAFRRIGLGPDGPLEGVRESAEWRDVIHLGGFSSGCYAWRERQSSLLVPGGALVQTRIQGSALRVLNEVLTWPELPT
jgi:hypothetical protein